MSNSIKIKGIQKYYMGINASHIKRVEKIIMEYTNDYYYGFDNWDNMGLVVEGKQQLLDYDLGLSLDKND